VLSLLPTRKKLRKIRKNQTDRPVAILGELLFTQVPRRGFLGILGGTVVTGFNVWSILVATLGAIILLTIYRLGPSRTPLKADLCALERRRLSCHAHLVGNDNAFSAASHAPSVRA
jgi:Transglycosylase associated protein